ncbi:hypothetical protein NI17_009460 [Thermobifida halotolerans]|uniref:Uncharacterized protein n=1 Tax=Thermobifida halotolerans TaxID=483545 RepID=A0A399G027_9ACTN|nr:hypothetical protein [Thermobifida halotolerans]UOE21325.1 hypothetical protein NI17_009460 [Thermobifida halotolerans]
MSVEAHTRARQVFQRVGDAHGEAQAWTGIGLVLAASGEAGKAVKALAQAVALFEATGDAHRAAIVRELIARVRKGPDSGAPD